MDVQEIRNLKKEQFKGKAFIYYFWGFPLIQFLITLVPDYSEVVVFLHLLCSCIIWCAENYTVNITQYKKPIILIGIVMLYFLYNLIFKRNDKTISYLIEFVMYGVLSLIYVYFINLKDKFIYYNCIAACMVFLIFSIVPIVGYEKLGMTNYMDFGFAVALPAYMSILLGRKYFKKNYLIIIEIFCFVEILFYANRSCLLSIAFLWLLVYIIDVKKKPFHMLIALLLLSIGVVMIINFKEIVNWVNDEIFVKNDLNVRAWQKIMAFVQNQNWDALFSGRLQIWQNAINMIKEKPWFGWGVGAFENIYGDGYYTHNLILEVLVELGCIFGILFLTILIIKIFKLMSSKDRALKMLSILFLAMVFPKLLLSSLYYKDIWFWGLIALILKYGKKELKNENINN